MSKTYTVDEVTALLASTRIALWPVESDNEKAPAYNGYADFRESGVEATDDATYSVRIVAFVPESKSERSPAFVLVPSRPKKETTTVLIN
jgi:hypothetical protein|tara:strand:+ start:1621 stop:1890 length:270 start_codon:yes stop_codon:yes gene_type:complete